MWEWFIYFNFLQPWSFNNPKYLQDFEGQKFAEKLFKYIILLFGVSVCF